MSKRREILKKLSWILREDDPEDPYYDPIHLGAMLVVCLTAAGALFWLLWTLLVFEGGIFSKLKALFFVLFTSKTLQDYGYRGAPYAMGAFEGWLGNLMALILTILLLRALHDLYFEVLRRAKK
ncbi:MAG: hypothetical protein HY921_09415 [Elusimicrobia bacterium]|nr:hypothetical protein [Elusimicrobiota bacterium]